mmetsp:Transcript_163315/g.313693  ORF Transcript_163315/g.313693 Transcript_163315/m.313693 type:complete len:307 (-) Transcript_163315:357-1277(-)
MPLVTSNSSKSVPGNASKPFLPFTMRSPSCGFIASQNSAFHVPSVKSLSLLQPARIPRFLFGLSEASSLKRMGAIITLAPFSRAALQTSAVLLSIFVSAMTSLTAGYNLPPSVANSFWNSMHRRAVLAASILQPPFALSALKTRVFFLVIIFTAGAALASVDQSAISVVKAAAVMGVENMPKVPSVAPLWPSAEVVAQQSVSVTTLKPFSQAVRIVDSTQQFVRKPQRTTVSMPFLSNNCSKSFPGNASKPFLPCTIRSPSSGFMASAYSAFQVPSVKSLSLAQPARMPRFLFGLSEPSSLNMMGA